MTHADFNLGTFTAATIYTPAMCLGVFFDLDLSAGSAALISWVIGSVCFRSARRKIS